MLIQVYNVLCIVLIYTKKKSNWVDGRVHWIVLGGQFLEKELGQVTGSLTQWVREAKITCFKKYT